MATLTDNSANVAERSFYTKQMKKDRAELQQAYMNQFNVSESTFYKRLKTIEFSPAEKRFFKEYVAKQGFNLDDFGNKSVDRKKQKV
jgi:hypothetical protein